MRSAIKKEDLVRYCKQHGIFIPKNENAISVEYLTAAITRMLMHGQSPELTIGCFGYWENEDMNCETCDFSDDCFKASIGMDKETYMKKFNKKDKILNLNKDFRKKGQ